MTITMQLTQWNKLKQDLIAQENDLTQLKQKLKQLKSTSSEQMQLLENLQSELNATRQSLMNANNITDRMQERAGKIESIIRDVESANQSNGT